MVKRRKVTAGVGDTKKVLALPAKLSDAPVPSASEVAQSYHCKHVEFPGSATLDAGK